MPLYLVEWRAINPQVSTSMFASGAFPLPATLKLVSSVHALDKPRGWAVIDGPSEEVYAAILALPPGVLLIEVNPVIDDHGAKKGLEKRHSEYKLK